LRIQSARNRLASSDQSPLPWDVMLPDMGRLPILRANFLVIQAY
jgi:hypothetical protein